MRNWLSSDLPMVIALAGNTNSRSDPSEAMISNLARGANGG